MSDPQKQRSNGKEPSTDAPDDAHRKRRVMATLEECITQDIAIRETLNDKEDHLLEIADAMYQRKINRIIIVGCGDSLIVGKGVRFAFERLLKIPMEPIQALDYDLYFHETADKHTAVIGISSSGKTRAVVNALTKAKEKGAYCLGMTNTHESPLGKDYSNHLIIHATRVGWPTQASTAGMAALIQLAIHLAKKSGSSIQAEIKDLEQALSLLPEKISALIDTAAPSMQALAQKWVLARYILFCGAGSNIAPAAFGAAKITELSPVRGINIQMEEFHHYRTIKPGDPLLLFAPDESSHVKALKTAEVALLGGGDVFAVIHEGETRIASIVQGTLAIEEVHEYLKPITYSIPAHLFAYYFAMAKFDAGLGYETAFPNKTG